MMKRKNSEAHKGSPTITKFFKAARGDDMDSTEGHKNGIINDCKSTDGAVKSKYLKIRLNGTPTDNSIKSRLERRFNTDLRSDCSSVEAPLLKHDLKPLYISGKENKNTLTSMENSNNSDSFAPEQCSVDATRERLYSDVSEGDLRSSNESLNSNPISLYSDISDDLASINKEEQDVKIDEIEIVNRKSWSSVSSVADDDAETENIKDTSMDTELYIDDQNEKDAQKHLECKGAVKDKSLSNNYGNGRSNSDEIEGSVEEKPLSRNCESDISNHTKNISTAESRNSSTETNKYKITTDLGNLFLSNSSQESLEDSDSEGEDLVPFNSDIYSRSIPQVATPKKPFIPVQTSPMTPASPTLNKIVLKEKKNCKFELGKILALRTEKKAVKLQQINHELADGISKGGIADIIDASIENSEDKEAILPYHEHKLEKYMLKADNDFSEELQGENVLCNLPQHNQGYTIPPLSMNGRSELRGIERQMTSKNEVELRELLCGQWILHYYLVFPCPDDVAIWLFDIMSHHQDVHIVGACYQALWALLKVGTEENRKGGIKWVLDRRSLLKIFFEFGATLPSLFPGGTDNMNLNLEDFDLDESNSDSQDLSIEPSAPLTDSPVERSFHSLLNASKIIQFTTHCLNLCSSKYSLEDLKCLMMIMTRLSLDLRLQDCWFDVQMCLSAILNSYGESQWNEEVFRDLCQILANVSRNHDSQLHVVQLLPYTERGILLRQCLGLQFLRSLVPQFVSAIKGDHLALDATKNQQTHDVMFETVQMSALVPLIKSLRPSDNSDYYLLHSIIGILDIVIGNETLKPYQKVSLDKLVKVLRSLNGEIRDPRAAFMDRTKVKNVVVRTINKLVYMSQSISSTQSSLKYFFDQPSDKIKTDVQLLTESPMKAILDENDDQDVDETHENEGESEDDGGELMDVDDLTGSFIKSGHTVITSNRDASSIKKSLFGSDGTSSEEN